MTRNQIIIIIVILVLIIGILLLLKLLAGPTPSPIGPAAPSATSAPAGTSGQFLQNLTNVFQQQQPGKIVPMPQLVIKAPSLEFFFANGYLYYYDKKTRQINYRSGDGTVNQFAQLTIYPKELFWSYATSSILALDTNNRFYFVQGGSTTTESLLTNAFWAAFEPSGQRIAVHNYNFAGTFNNVSLISLQDLSQKKIQDINLQDIRLAWPAQDRIALWENPSSDVASPLFLLTFKESTKGITSQDLTEILPEATGLSAIFSPDGRYGLVSFANSQSNINDILIDLTANKTLTTFDFATFAQKCSFSQDSKYLVCAVPIQALTSGDIDSWQRDEEAFDDKFLMVDLAKMKEANISDQTFGIDAVSINLDQADNLIYFLNKKDKLIYSLELPQGVFAQTTPTSTATSTK